MQGDKYKYKTKKYFEKKGYMVEYLERVQTLKIRNRYIYIKKDIFGADLLAINKDELLFIQVKSGKDNTGIKKSEAISELEKIIMPKCKHIKKQLFIWRKFKREPEIIEVK
ncbi:MAG TPA: hypothetical protein PLD27_11160 [bacterium]|nr:hypothetical protein [bacterium]